MNYRAVLLFGLFFFSYLFVFAQEVRMREKASMEQIYGETQESEELMSMNELGVDFGYMLYETSVTIGTEECKLEIENVRDFAMVYVDGKPMGRLTGESRKLDFRISPGVHTLKLYVENIGRVTYGPEILDNSKGLFGSVSLNGVSVENWKMTVLEVRDCPVDGLTFGECDSYMLPGFYAGTFRSDASRDTNLDMSGWTMGEVWVNGQYVGAYWTENAERSVSVPASILKDGENRVVIFELGTGAQAVRLSETPVFK